MSMRTIRSGIAWMLIIAFVGLLSIPFFSVYDAQSITNQENEPGAIGKSISFGDSTYVLDDSNNTLYRLYDDEASVIIEDRPMVDIYIEGDFLYASELDELGGLKSIKIARLVETVDDSYTDELQTYVTTNNELTIFDYLTGPMGLNVAAACGILANIQAESSFDPAAYNPTDGKGTSSEGPSYGICQWHDVNGKGGRYTQLMNWCKNNGYDYTSLIGQLNYLNYELNSGYRISVLDYLQSNSVQNDAEGAYNAGFRWCYYFEIPDNLDIVSGIRGNNAKNYYWPKYSAVPAASPSITQLSYIGGKTITLSAESGSTIYYTVNGSDPTTSALMYTSPFNVSNSVTIKAIAVKTGYSNSKVASQMVTVTKLAPPVIDTTSDTAGILVTLRQASGAEIRYTLDGSTPTVNSTKYVGGFRVATSTNVKAIAVQTGLVSSDIASKQVNPASPGAPDASLYETPSRVAAGSGVKVKWDKVPNASSYEVNLYYKGWVVSTQTTSGTKAAFILHNEGAYEIRVSAINFYGVSAESYAPVTVEAMALCKATFKDWDGTIITEIEVDYDGTPVFPKPPTRKGYNFDEWSIPTDTKIQEDVIITARYSTLVSTVNFYDTNGVTLLSSQRVEYNKSATPPSTYSISPGYAFAGWHITYDSAGTSFSPVDGTVMNGVINVVATQALANPDMPIIIRIDQAYREGDSDTYFADVGLTSENSQITRCRLIATLKTANGKMVASQIEDFQIKQGNPGAEQIESIAIKYSGRATTLEVVAVRIDSGNSTGGAYSKIVTSGIANKPAGSDPAAGTEDATGGTYYTTGVLADDGLADYSGRVATVLVYQRADADLTAERLQYVGQTVIGNGNTYSFRFKPKEDPSPGAGRLIVALALEGATRNVIIDVKEAPKAEYTVTYLSDGGELSCQSVYEGNTAIVPGIPRKEGYTFVGWDDCPTNVSSDLVISAAFRINRYIVVLVDSVSDTVEMNLYTYGDNLGALPIPQSEGKAFKGWYTIIGGAKQIVDSNTIVTGNILIIADWEAINHTVTFVNQDGAEVSTQVIAHGASANPPSTLQSGSLIFSGWSTDVAWWNVTDDLTVHPIFKFSQTAEAPMVSSELSIYKAVNIVRLESSTQNATIYYNVESLASAANSTANIGGEGGNSDENNEHRTGAKDDLTLAERFPYVYSDDDPIEITEDVRLTFVAVANGMNSSETIIVDVMYVDHITIEPPNSYVAMVFAEGATVYPGGKAEIPVYISGVVGINELSISLSYNRSALTRVSASASGGLEISDVSKLIASSDGDGNILLITLQFEVAATAQLGDYQVTITPIAKDAYGKTIKIDSTVAFVIVAL